MATHKKPERSKIATDPDRPLIERSLAMGIPMTQIAARFGYSLKAISRYRDRMPPQLKAAITVAALRPRRPTWISCVPMKARASWVASRCPAGSPPALSG